MENLPQNQSTQETAEVHSHFEPLQISLSQKGNNHKQKNKHSAQSRNRLSPNPQFPEAPEIETVSTEDGSILKIIITCTCGQQLELNCDYTEPSLKAPEPSSEQEQLEKN